VSTAVELFDLHADGTPPADPLTLAHEWLPADDEPERPQITLATLGTDGWPDARTVLLTAFDASGFAFHTSAASRKVAELAASPRAAMVVLWPGFTRQLVLRGDVLPDAEESVSAAWTARSDHLRQLAWCNTDELAARPQAERQRRWAAWAANPAPGQAAGWVGYRLVPREMTFWAAGYDAASRRLQYTRDGDGSWRWRHLAG
jgi:pyridoxamine 5'-phosphate oxidase